MAEKLTTEDHKKMHILLHKALDELFADYIYHHPDLEGGYTNQPIIELLNWSCKQTENPTEQ